MAVYLSNTGERNIMPAIKKQVNEARFGEVTIDNNLKNHDNDPYVLKKVEKARQMVNKYGLPGGVKK